MFGVDAAQGHRIVVPAKKSMVQRVGTDAVLERRPRNPKESPAALRGGEPEVPILPIGERDVVAAGVVPDRAAHDRAGVDVVAPEQSREIELGHHDVAAPRAELTPVAIHHARGGIGIEQRHRFRGEAGQQPVVGIERKEVVAGGFFDPAVASGGKSGVRLLDDAMPRLAKRGEHLARARLRRAVVHDDDLRLGGVALDAGDGIDQIVAVVVARDDHGEARPRVRCAHATSHAGFPTPVVAEVRGVVERAEELHRLGVRAAPESRQRVVVRHRDEEIAGAQPRKCIRIGLDAEMLLHRCGERRRVAQQAIRADEQRAVAMALMEVEQAAVVMRPDPRRVVGMREPDLGAGAQHRIGHFPRMAIEQQVARVRAEHVVPEIEEHRRARILPAPRMTGAVTPGDERRGRIAMCRQRRGVERLALRPAPVAMPGLGRRAGRQDAAVELEEVDVLEVAGRIGAVGRQQAVAHPDVPGREQRGDERGARPVHAGHDQSKGMGHQRVRVPGNEAIDHFVRR